MSEETVPQKLIRPSCPALDEILGVPFEVLDKGFVRVVDYMGDDSSVVAAARVSYGKGTKKVSEDEGLIRYLFRHAHSTPVEMAQIKFHVRVPMDCWRQWIRHRMSSTNEYSTRYSEAIDDKQQTASDAWRLQSGTNKQGSGGMLKDWSAIECPLTEAAEFLTPGKYLSSRETAFHAQAAALYQERLRFGVAKEQARKDLPLSTYTEAYWTADLHNLLHFLSLRMDSHAQLEIRSYANVIGDIVSKWVPLTWAAFNDYHFRRNALLLSARDKVVLRAIVNRPQLEVFGFGTPTAPERAAAQFGWLDRRDDGSLKDNRERIEFEKKIAQLGLTAPWKE